MPTGTHVKYYHVCHRKVWLFHHRIEMEHTSDLVAEGQLIGERTYPQRTERYREVTLDGAKIDFYDPHHRVVHEIKKSDKLEHSHVAQVKFYLYLLRQHGIEGATGLIEYPKLRRTEPVGFDEGDETLVENWLADIGRITASDTCPERLPKSRCRHCSYFEFCWVDETPEP